jgi:hypothetical protein
MRTLTGFVILCFILIALIGCEPGQVRVKREQLFGTYETEFSTGLKHIPLRRRIN